MHDILLKPLQHESDYPNHELNNSKLYSKLQYYEIWKITTVLWNNDRSKSTLISTYVPQSSFMHCYYLSTGWTVWEWLFVLSTSAVVQGFPRSGHRRCGGSGGLGSWGVGIGRRWLGRQECWWLSKCYFELIYVDCRVMHVSNKRGSWDTYCIMGQCSNYMWYRLEYKLMMFVPAANVYVQYHCTAL